MKPSELEEECGAKNLTMSDIDCCNAKERSWGNLIWVVDPGGRAYYAVKTEEGLVPLHDLVDYDGLGG